MIVKLQNHLKLKISSNVFLILLICPLWVFGMWDKGDTYCINNTIDISYYHNVSGYNHGVKIYFRHEISLKKLKKGDYKKRTKS